MEVLTRLENGKLVIYRRDGVFYARLAVGTNKYQHRSLKTGNAEQATLTAQKLWAEFTVRQQLGLPISLRTMNSVIDEYVALREKQHKQGRTSAHMLRQIHRVVQFWRQYAGKRQITQIGDSELSGYVDWRRDYYADMTDEELPQNAKLNPTDKTLQWEITLAKSIIKYAQQQGYRGHVPFPTFSFTPKTKRVRPAFSLVDYRKLWRALIRWERDCDDERYLHTRQLLAALYEEMGDVRNDIFKKWWTEKQRGARLFGEKQLALTLRELSSPAEWDATWDEANVLVVALSLSLGKRHLQGAFARLLKKRHKSKRGRKSHAVLSVASTANFKLCRQADTHALGIQLAVYDACTANIRYGKKKTLADIGVELKLVPTAQPKRDDDKRTVAHKRIVMAAAVSRYYRQAQHIVANTALGVFPKSD